jgi:hypothetical protein
MERNDDPFFRYTDEERMKMSREEYCALIEESNEYVRKKYSQLNEQEMPRFNTIKELMDYYEAIPLDDMINNMNKLFEN